jgi:hypothetical protein
VLVVVQDERGADHGPRPQLREQRPDDRRAVAEIRGQLPQERMRVRGEAGIDLPARCDDVVDEDGPVTVVFVQPIPERSHAGSPAPVRQKGCLPVAGVGDDEGEPRPGLRVEPIKQPVTLKRLLGEERGLDLADLDRIAEDFHVVLLGGVRGAMRDLARSDRDQERRHRRRVARDGDPGTPTTREIMVGSRETLVGPQGNGAGSQGSHAGHRAARCSTAAYLDLAGPASAPGRRVRRRDEVAPVRRPRTRSRS